jgi:ATP-dependent Clp protease adaptor protein ClpS
MDLASRQPHASIDPLTTADTGFGTNVALLERVESDVELPYEVLLWDDPVSTTELVVVVLQKVFSYPKEKARSLMIAAHTSGRAAVWTGERVQAESYAVQLHTFGLTATVTKS